MDHTATYTYEALNRLRTGEAKNFAGQVLWSQTYTYDRYGNLTQTTSTKCSSPAPCYSVDAANRLYKTCSEGSQSLFYDVAGNLTNDHGVTYTWNAEGRVATTAGVTYTYDGDGRRAKKSNGKLFWYGVNGEELFETDLSGNLIAEYIYLSGRVIARRDASGTVYYFFSDHLGSLRVVTNATGQIQRDADFYPYGTERVVTGTVDDPNKFAGMYYDSESGLHHTLYRQYSTTLGRWLSADPQRGIPAIPQSQHLYLYARNNPTNVVDPRGDCAWLPIPMVWGYVRISCYSPENRGSCCPYYDRLRESPNLDDQGYGVVGGLACRTFGDSCWSHCVRKCLVRRDIRECRPLPTATERINCRIEIHVPKCWITDCGWFVWTLVSSSIVIPIPAPVFINVEIRPTFSCEGLF